MIVAPRCIRAGALAARRAAGLSNAERLRLERHLEHCPQCPDDYRRLDLMRELVEAIPAGAPQARARAIGVALDRLGRAPEHTRARWRVFAWAVPAAIVASLVLALVRDRSTESADIAVISIAPDRLGQIADAAPQDVAAGSEVVVMADTTIDLGRATIEAESGTRFAWDPKRATFELRSGAATFDVTAAAGAPFRVVTAQFLVEVIGTRFRVGDRGVRVERGRVRILAPGGAVLDADLSAGERWTFGAPAKSGPVKPAARPRFREALARARASLAAREVANTRSQLAAILAAGPPAVHEAAARNLLAECALVEGDRDHAVRLYLEAARRFPSLAAGENALFAAARLEGRARRAGAARSLLQEYLDRYPRGRFRVEAAAHLQALEEP